MKIQINSDNHIHSNGALAAQVSVMVELALQRCMRQPLPAATLQQAVQGAVQKMVHLLDASLGRLHAHRGKTSGTETRPR